MRVPFFSVFTARKAALIELVVGFDAQVIDFPFSYIIRDITQNRQEAAFVFRDFFTVDIDVAAVSDAAETQLNVSVMFRYEEVSFIPEITAVILGILIGKQVLETGWNRQGNG